MTKLDINEAFTAEKIAQRTAPADRLASLTAKVESGELRIVSDDGQKIRYEFLAGWDRGEYMTFDRKTLDVAMNTGLETDENGNVSLYLKDKPAWHALGTVIPGGLSDVDSVLKAGGLDWTVEKSPIRYLNPVTNEMEIFPRQYLTHRSDTGKALGTVGEIYTPVQNREAYEMLEDLIGLGMVCESAGVLAGGTRVFVTAEIPEAIMVDPGGLNDPIRQFLALLNSHDGKTPFVGLRTPWRIACGNTHNFALRDASAKISIRHTKNAKNKIEEARRVLGLTLEYYGELAQEETELVHTEITLSEADKLIAEINAEGWPVKLGADGKPSKRSETVTTKRVEKMHELFEFESGRVGRNAYALENAVTGYVDHYADLRPRGDLKGNRLAALGNAILNEDNDKVKKLTHTKLLTLRTR